MSKPGPRLWVLLSAKGSVLWNDCGPLVFDNRSKAEIALRMKADAMANNVTDGQQKLDAEAYRAGLRIAEYAQAKR